MQFEAEAYPTSFELKIMLIWLMHTAPELFPDTQGRIELWQVLPAGWAVSAGLNYYYFDRNIFIALASVEKYLGNTGFPVRCYVYFKDNGPTTSFYLNAQTVFQ